MASNGRGGDQDDELDLGGEMFKLYWISGSYHPQSKSCKLCGLF